MYGLVIRILHRENAERNIPPLDGDDLIQDECLREPWPPLNEVGNRPLVRAGIELVQWPLHRRLGTDCAHPTNPDISSVYCASCSPLPSIDFHRVEPHADNPIRREGHHLQPQISRPAPESFPISSRASPW